AILDVERDLARHVADGERSYDAVAISLGLLDSRAFEPELGKLVRVEEIRGAKVRISLCSTGFDAGSVDGRFPAPLRDGTVVEIEGATEFSESASNLGDHHVPDREIDARVNRIDVPFAGRHFDSPYVKR